MLSLYRLIWKIVVQRAISSDFGSTKHRLHSTFQETHIWRVLYKAQYIHATPESEKTRRVLRQEDYFLLFQDRRRLDKRLLAALDHLIDTDERERLSALDVFCSLREDPDAVCFEDGFMALSQFEGMNVKDVSAPPPVSVLAHTHTNRMCQLRGRLAVTSDLPGGFAPKITVEARNSSFCRSCTICASMRREGFLLATPGD